MAYLGISRRAARDNEEIRSFSVEHWGHKVVEDYLDHIEGALQRPRQNPTLLRRKPEFSRHFRFSASVGTTWFALWRKTMLTW